MRLVIILMVVLLVVGGGGAGAYYYFNQPVQASVGEEAKEGAKKVEEAKKGHGEGEKVEYVKLDPLILPIVDKDGLTQVVSLVVAIEVSSEADKITVTQLVPRLTDAFIQDMYGVLNGEAMKGGVIQVGYLKERLNKISAKVLGGEMSSDVLLQVVQQRPA
jgi:flagellar FliL protein